MNQNGYGPSDRDLGWSPEDMYPEEYPPCRMCKGPNDMGEICAKCAKTHEPYDGDVERPGGWMVQDR